MSIHGGRRLTPKTEELRAYVEDLISSGTDLGLVLITLARIAGDQANLWSDDERREKWGREAGQQERRWDSINKRLKRLGDDISEESLSFLYHA